MAFEKYEHYDKDVWVRSDLKGKHRDHCLCWVCKRFNPDDREHNCGIANLNYSLCCAFNLVLPVWECPEFLEKK